MSLNNVPNLKMKIMMLKYRKNNKKIRIKCYNKAIQPAKKNTEVKLSQYQWERE